VTVTAMLAWFDEPLDLLITAVTGAAVIADRIVAADGAYELVPDRKASSPQKQRLAIRETARKVGLECEFLRPRLWKGQVEKRNSLLQEAVQGSDWVFPVDADWRIEGDREAIRDELEDTEFDSLAVNFFQPSNPERDTSKIAPHRWHAENAGQTSYLPILMRVFPEMRVEKLHWVYSGVKDERRIGLWGGAHFYPPGSVGTLRAPHRFEHRCLFRDDKTLERNRIFCEERDRERERVGFEA
jgi:hypothetical protein